MRTEGSTTMTGRWCDSADSKWTFVRASCARPAVRVRLQDQPFHILAMLLERRGDIVTREEIRDRLWPDGTFVDFEHSVNAAIKRLRAALGDTAENPRFVETLHRRGYRFVAPIEQPAARRARR